VNSPDISIVIPTTNKIEPELWRRCFMGYTKQLYSNFEIIIVFNTSDADKLHQLEEIASDYINDLDITFIYHPSHSAADARNTGVKYAKSDIFLFVGDDCIPSRGLVLNHMHVHLAHGNDRLFGVQGYSPFHDDVMGTQFMQYLDESGLQANWAQVLNNRISHGYCLTTNFSINRETWNMLDGFSEFPKAAWEDVEFGYRMNKLQIPTIFEIEAVNYHYHEHDLASFAQRQRMEGRNRFLLWQRHPEMIASMVNLDDLRKAANENIDEWVAVGRQFDNVDINRIPDAKEVKYKTYNQVLNMASLIGVADYTNDVGYPLNLILTPEITNANQVIYLMNLQQSINDGDYGYAQHCIEWLLQSGVSIFSLQDAQSAVNEL
jgi:glycosyltransferase involved in cell wall biosynthesis